MPDGLFAPIQVAHWPFQRNWQHLPWEPSHFFLEVGANNHELEREQLEPLLQDGPNGFLVSFEPLLDKYSYLISFSSGGGAENNAAVNLGLQHRRGLALPYAIGDKCGAESTAVFHVTSLDGCSSLRAPTPDFEKENQRAGISGMSWPRWVVERCSNLQEERVVPCASLATVIGQWLAGRHIARMKIDAQGSDLDVLKSAGPYLDRVLYVTMEVHSKLAAPIYHGQASCEEVLLTMKQLGFVLADSRRIRSACNMTMPESDLDFVRREVSPAWRSFYKDYSYCQILSAAGSCGGPLCLAPQIRAQVNRTGACEGFVQDVLTFEADALGMVHVWLSPDCLGNLEIRMVNRRVMFFVHQGLIKRKACLAQSSFIPSSHGPMVRLQVGRHGTTAGPFKSKLVILGGLFTAADESQSLNTYLDASGRSGSGTGSGYWSSDAWDPDSRVYTGADIFHTHRLAVQSDEAPPAEPSEPRTEAEPKMRGDRSIYEHEVLSRILESIATVDQLNVSGLQGVELLVRRLQVIREAHRISPSSPDYSSAEFFMGWKYRKGAHGVDPDLAHHVAAELKSEAMILKESRKAKEEAQARRRNPGDKKGGRRRRSKVMSGMGGADSAGAVQELLQCDSSYSQEDFVSTVRPYQRDLISLPETGDDPVSLDQVLDEHGQVLGDPLRSMLLSDEEWGEVLEKGELVRPYMDECIPEGSTLYLAQSDIKDYFYSLALPQDLQSLFCLPAIAKSAMQDWALDLDQVDCDAEGIDEQRVQQVKNKIVDRLREIGFRVHEELEACSIGQSPGFLVDGAKGVVTPIPERVHKVRLALDWLARQPWVTGKQVERLIGHCVHFMLLRGELLSIFRAMYDFVQKSYLQKRPLFASAAREAKWASALLGLCSVDLRKDWCERITASDASLSGVAVCCRELPRDEVAAIGSQREPWRYKYKELPPPREAALSFGDPFSDPSTVKPLKHGLEQPDPFELNEKFIEVPQNVLQPELWHEVFAVHMKYPEHITLLESRGVAISLKHKFRSVQHFGKRHLHLGDNMGVILMIAKGRSSSFYMLKWCRRLCALLLCTDSVLSPRWIPSELNVADKGSRRWEPHRKKDAAGRAWEKSKLERVDEFCYPTRASGPDPRQVASSTKQEAPPANVRKTHFDKKPADKAKTRAEIVRQRSDPPRFKGQTNLERLAVSEAVARDHTRRINDLRFFARQNRISLRSAKNLDEACALFLNNIFEQGVELHEGSKFVAAVKDAFPEFGHKSALPRMVRALQGWTKIDPQKTRPPLPWELVAGIAMKMRARRRQRAALAVLTMFSAYLRRGDSASYWGAMDGLDEVRSMDLGIGNISLARSPPAKKVSFDGPQQAASQAPQHAHPQLQHQGSSEYWTSGNWDFVEKIDVDVLDTPSTQSGGGRSLPRKDSNAYWDAEQWDPDERVYVGAEAGQTNHLTAVIQSDDKLIRAWAGGLSCPGSFSGPVDILKALEWKGAETPELQDLYDVTAESVGFGSFGIVRKATHRETDTHCVVKSLKKSQSGSSYKSQVDGGLYDELMSMSVHSPYAGIVKYMDLLESADHYYVVMEDLQGPELLEQMERLFPVTEAHCQGVMREVLMSLAHIHDKVKVCHRDIKLDNFRYRSVEPGSPLVLLDFGFLARLDKPWDGKKCGTRMYMAPEVIADAVEQPYLAAIDMWSVGVILYTLFTGDCPVQPEEMQTLGTRSHEAQELLAKAWQDER
ncbi:unnamed protein product [Durusdinium trenchii]|uniref:Protein kinase domain-containing protein n=1 Tax=Durusdinium trenchii TaxID=1381693 RepID=A0ABP0JGK5_9DINO